MIKNEACQEMLGQNELDDFIKKAKFFLEFDGPLFKELFIQDSYIPECPNIQITFRKLLIDFGLEVEEG